MKQAPVCPSDFALDTTNVELARTVVSRLRQFVGDRRRSHRRRVRLPFTIFVAGAAKKLNGARRVQTVDGSTHDISANGLALIVPTIRVGDHHLVGNDRGFTVRLQLPSGPVDMQVITVRYENLGEDSRETGFLIGVKIIAMDENDRRRFDDYFNSRSSASS